MGGTDLILSLRILRSQRRRKRLQLSPGLYLQAHHNPSFYPHLPRYQMYSVDRLNRQYEKLREAVEEPENVGPLESSVKSLQKEIAAVSLAHEHMRSAVVYLPWRMFPCMDRRCNSTLAVLFFRMRLPRLVGFGCGTPFAMGLQPMVTTIVSPFFSYAPPHLRRGLCCLEAG